MGVRRAILTQPYVALTRPFDDSDEMLLKAWAHVPTEKAQPLYHPVLESEKLCDRQRRRVLRLRDKTF